MSHRTGKAPDGVALHPLLDHLPQEHIQQASPLGLALRPGMDLQTWSALVATVAQSAGRITRNRDTLTAWLGDLLAYGGGKYRGQITEYAAAAGLDPGTLRVAKLVCSRIPVLSRHNALSWSHHCEVGRAFKDPGEIKRWLELAVKEALSVRALRKRIRLHLAEVAAPDKALATVGVPPAVLTLLNELRAAGRIVAKHPRIWATWTPAMCELALVEMNPLVELIDAMRSRAGSDGSPRRAS